MSVMGIDVSEVAIRKLQQRNTNHCIFICDDFVNVEAIYQIQYDYCYNRFTLQAINEEQETQILENIGFAIVEMEENDKFASSNSE